MITDQDITKLKTIFATKQEFKELNKKVDKIDSTMATKKELKGVKNDILDEMNEKFDRMLLVMATKQELNELKVDVRETKSMVEGIVTSLDNFIIGPFKDMKEDYSAVSVQLDRHDGWIKTLAGKAGVKLAVE
mgnify:CR=1 FL=1